MGWQRRLYARQEPSRAFRAWTSTLGGLIILLGASLLYYGGQLFNEGSMAVGGVLLLLSLPFLVVGLGVVFIALMKWTNPGL